MNPRRIVKDAGVVEVEHQSRGQHVGGTLADHDRAPWCLARSLHAPLHALGIGGEPGAEHHAAVVEVEVGGRIVKHGGLMDVDIESFVRLHLQCRLHTCRREGCEGPSAAFVRDVGELAYLRELRLGGIELLGAVVAGNPPRRMVAGHGKLAELFLDHEVGQRVVLRELIAEAQSVVVQPEADEHHVGILAPLAAGKEWRLGRFLQLDEQLVVVVAYLCLFAPDGFPCLVEGAGGGILEREAAVEVVVVEELKA